jgi:hypothetical protein
MCCSHRFVRAVEIFVKACDRCAEHALFRLVRRDHRLADAD